MLGACRQGQACVGVSSSCRAQACVSIILMPTDPAWLALPAWHGADTMPSEQGQAWHRSGFDDCAIDRAGR